MAADMDDRGVARIASCKIFGSSPQILLLVTQRISLCGPLSVKKQICHQDKSCHCIFRELKGMSHKRVPEPTYWGKGKPERRKGRKERGRYTIINDPIAHEG